MNQLSNQTLLAVVKSLNADVKVTVGDTVFPCHKSLLSISSQYFRSVKIHNMLKVNLVALNIRQSCSGLTLSLVTGGARPLNLSHFI